MNKENIDAALDALNAGKEAEARALLGLSPDTSFDGGRRFVGKSKPSKRVKSKRKAQRKARRKNR